MKKKFPFYKQLGPTDCGPTCLKIIAKYYGKEVSTSSIIRKSDILKSGISISSLAKASEMIGFRVMPLKTDFSFIEKEIPLPCIVYLGKSHYAVVYKVSKSHIYLSDPAIGLVKYNKREFEEKWIIKNTYEEKGISLVLEPNSSFHKKLEEEKSEKGLKFLLKYFYEHKKLFFQLLIGLFFGSILELIFPFFTQSIVDQGIKNKDVSFITIVLIGQLVFFLAQTIITFIRGWLLLHIGIRVHVSIISDFLYKTLKLSSYIYDVKTVGDLMQRIDDNRRIENFLSNTSLTVVFSILNVLLLGVVLFIYNTTIFFIFLLGTLMYFFWILFFVKKNSYWERKRVEKNSEEREKVLQLINGVKDIKLNNSHLKRTFQWREIQSELFKISSKRLFYRQLQNNGALSINELKNIFILFFSANLVIKGEMTLGMMLAVQYITGYLNRPIRDIILFIQSLEDVNIRIKRMEEILNEPDEGEGSSIIHMPVNESIKLSKVSFGYGGADSKKVLKNINLNIEHNKTTAIVGVSGSGKTTLLNLLLKFYETNNGSIEVGNLNIKDFDPNQWRKMCGAVLQDSLIFSDSIANNIAESERDEFIDKVKLVQAARVANLLDVIENLPSGFDTLIGPGGIKLSGGQTQRLLIARAVYKNPNYLFFDEATSFLDALNEKLIVNNLEEFFKKRTVVVVAHRLSTVKNANKIVVLDKGEIVEEGSHDELINRKNKYYNLVKNQLELGK
ncbi:peptidase domain-containing ABC transporter [Tenacibaculum sp. A30]|uniref:peptidase domain-containing ABC transporter n=1 Tax=Tenacibaculum sp. A30 TaxID=3442644 RepID=UPI003EBB7C8E